jgi:hypothetical protein
MRRFDDTRRADNLAKIGSETTAPFRRDGAGRRGAGFFYAPAGCYGLFIPPGGAGAKWTFLLAERYLTIFCKGLYRRSAGRCQGDRSGRTPGGLQQ